MPQRPAWMGRRRPTHHALRSAFVGASARTPKAFPADVVTLHSPPDTTPSPQLHALPGIGIRNIKLRHKGGGSLGVNFSFEWSLQFTSCCLRAHLRPRSPFFCALSHAQCLPINAARVLATLPRLSKAMSQICVPPRTYSSFWGFCVRASHSGGGCTVVNVGKSLA